MAQGSHTTTTTPILPYTHPLTNLHMIRAHLSLSQIMRILDQDPIVSKALRDPGHLDQFVKEYAASRRR